MPKEEQTMVLFRSLITNTQLVKVCKADREQIFLRQLTQESGEQDNGSNDLSETDNLFAEFAGV